MAWRGLIPCIVIPLTGVGWLAGCASAQAIAPCELPRLVASDGASNDYFGSAVATDGQRLIVGAPLDDVPGAVDAGSAYVFARSGGEWIFEAKLLASDAHAGDLFGSDVGIDGDTAVVGAQHDTNAGGESAGAAYVFVRNGTQWIEQGKLVPNDPLPHMGFGISVAISGSTVIVGMLFEEFAPLVTPGAGYVFTRDDSTWTQQAKLTAADAIAQDQFGGQVALNDNTAVIGSFFDSHDGGFWAGSAYAFARESGIWTEPQKLVALDAMAEDGFGGTVGVCGDTIILGAVGVDSAAGAQTGAAYVFIRVGGLWVQQQKLTAFDAQPSDYFGHAVAVSGDHVFIGVSNDDHSQGVNAGSGYLFRRYGSTWTQAAKLVPADADANEFAGLDIALHDAWAMMSGSRDDNSNGVDAGAAYVFSIGPDCNSNGIADGCDIQSGTSVDVNGNGIPDQCETPPCPGDVNDDNTVNVTDLLAVIGAWGATGPNPADVNNDGLVNVTDLLAVIGAWGACP